MTCSRLIKKRLLRRYSNKTEEGWIDDAFSGVHYNIYPLHNESPLHRSLNCSRYL